jgi:hypothetical protein
MRPIAAGLSESKHLGCPTWGDADDRVKAKNLALLAADHNTGRAETLINAMIVETHTLVEQHWPDIAALAQRLLIKGRVNFLEVEAECAEASDRLMAGSAVT